jgi:DNA-binding NarL/FixJ family response regulator
MSIPIGIFDDHPMILKGIKSELENENYTVVFSTGSVTDLFEHLKTTSIEILILDIVVPNVTGIELFEKVSKAHPEIKIIAYTSLGSVLLIDNLLRVGVKGYVNKNDAISNLLVAMDEAMNGGTYLPDEYKFLLKNVSTSEVKTLSAREIEVLKLITQEYSSKEIADQLFISVNTVENHRKNIFYKLQVKNLAGLIVAATANGYIS